ncbi:MAG: aromatic ring-hydroxylating dioxygenase subunit alpha, partial [Pseudomonadota bacterium]|nr:aromatic ring-hydroxylating dioxygenase subunit alpha [Pseudomonadota bacterium]
MPKTVEKKVSYDLSMSLKKAELASSLPPPFYTSKTLAQQEIELFFRQSWIGVGRSDIVSGPGDYITLDVANQHIILLRDKKSKLRAFANTCRHRSARIIDGKGSCKGLRCPFHSWFYDLEGKLISAPDMINAVGFKKKNYGLIQYLAEERFGFVFISINRDATSIDDYLGNFADFHKSWPLERLVTVRRREIIVECNWKMFLEVFNEYYHLPFVHPNSVNSIYKKPKPADDVTGDFASQFGLTEGTGGLLEGSQDYALPDMPGLEGEAKIGARYTWLFPN